MNKWARMTCSLLENNNIFLIFAFPSPASLAVISRFVVVTSSCKKRVYILWMTDCKLLLTLLPQGFGWGVPLRSRCSRPPLLEVNVWMESNWLSIPIMLLLWDEIVSSLSVLFLLSLIYNNLTMTNHSILYNPHQFFFFLKRRFLLFVQSHLASLNSFCSFLRQRTSSVSAAPIWIGVNLTQSSITGRRSPESACHEHVNLIAFSRPPASDWTKILKKHRSVSLQLKTWRHVNFVYKSTK